MRQSDCHNLSAAMLMRYSLDLHDRAEVIESAVQAALAQGARTADFADKKTPHVMGTRKMTSASRKFNPMNSKKRRPPYFTAGQRLLLPVFCGTEGSPKAHSGAIAAAIL
jgi:hypothetical protein